MTSPTTLAVTLLLTLTSLTPCVHPAALTSGYDGCDDGQVDTWRDWNTDDTTTFTCRQHDAKGKVTHRPPGDPTLKVTECTLQADNLVHRCMKEHITYSSPLPTSGPDRPVPPAWGDYRYLPPPRWMSSLARGGIVFLYHPCADPGDVEVVKEVARGCLMRHVVSPYLGIGKTYNFAVLAWKCKFVFSAPSVADIVTFVKLHALHGPENDATGGAYRTALLRSAAVVTDVNDTVLCPSTAERKLFEEKVKEESFAPKEKSFSFSPKEDSLSDSEERLVGELKELTKDEYKSRFEPFRDIIDLSGRGAGGNSHKVFLPNEEFDSGIKEAFGSNSEEESFQSDVRDNSQFLRDEEKKLEGDLQQSEEKLAEIREEIEDEE